MTVPLHYPFPEPPPPGETLELRPGVLWLRLPLPYALDHINVWLLRDGEGWALVDSGLGRRTPAKRLWRRVLRDKAVTRVFATHFHPDHLGLAGWLCETTGTELWTTQGEWLTGRLFQLASVQKRIDARIALLASHGLDAALLEENRAAGDFFAGLTTPLPGHYRRIRHGEAVTIDGEPWRVIVGRGHAPELASLYGAARRVLISGDQILPRISPIVPVVSDEPDGDPLGLYLESLEGFADLPEDTLVLPSHGLPFLGLPQRLAALAAHHEERLEQIAEACVEPRTAASLLPLLFRRPLAGMNISMAMGETLAHLNRLWHLGRLRRERGADGVFRFGPAA